MSMTTDITELAQSLKAAAEKAEDNSDPNMFVQTIDILALVEVLEKAQTQIIVLKQLAESRTVTVRMPGSYQTSCSESEKYLCPVDVEQAVLSAGADAGIKIDIKWEDE